MGAGAADGGNLRSDDVLDGFLKSLTSTCREEVVGEERNTDDV